MANVARQDTNSMSLSRSSYIERNIVKSKKQYTSARTDMVDAYMADASSIKKIDKDRLPDELKGKSDKEINKVIDKKQKERVSLQREIKILEKQRTQYLVKKVNKEDKNLGSAIIQSIRKQAKENGFKFSEYIEENK